MVLEPLDLDIDDTGSSPQSEFDFWFIDERGTGINYETEPDADSCEEDDYSEEDSE
jgi:hypothetical protein